MSILSSCAVTKGHLGFILLSGPSALGWDHFLLEAKDLGFRLEGFMIFFGDLRPCQVRLKMSLLLPFLLCFGSFAVFS